MKKKYVVIAISVIIIALIVACGQMFTVRHVSVVFYNKTGLADEAGVLKATGLSGRNNIFNVQETELKKNIASAYPDNSIEVTQIERKFPNKIVIYVKERLPIFKIRVYTNDGVDRFVPTDKDFQRGTVQAEEDITLTLIDVRGFGVYETFDVKECNQLRALVSALLATSLEEEALPYLISSISFSDDGYMNVIFRETGAMMSVYAENVAEETQILFNDYLQLSAIDRYGAILKIQ